MTRSGGDVAFAFRRAHTHADDSISAGQKLCHFGLQEEMEVRQPLRFLGKEIQKFPLRHQDHVFAARRQLREVADDEAVLADFGGDCFDLVMRTRKQPCSRPSP